MSDVTFSRFFSWSFGKPTLPMIQQTELAECGLACLAMVAGYYGREVDLNVLRQRFDTSLKGETLAGVMQVAERLDFNTRPLRVKLERLKSLLTPAILHWDLNHFVVLKKADEKKVVIHNPACGVRTYSWDEVSLHFTGIALELTPSQQFQPLKEKIKPTIGMFFEKIPGIRSGIAQLTALSLLLLLFSVASPFYMQLVLDRAIGKGDLSMLVQLTLGFFLVSLINIVISLLRSRLVLAFTNRLNFQMSVNVLRHLLYLPLTWFEKRHIGDVISRFSSTGKIRQLLTDSLIAALIDGLMAVISLGLMLCYSAWLTALVVGFTVIYAAARLLVFPKLRAMSEESMEAEAKCSSNLMETVRGIQSIKIFSREQDRRSLWQKRFMDLIDTSNRYALFSANYGALFSVVQTVEGMLITFLGALLVLRGGFTVGMLMAFLSYQSQFSGKAAALLGGLIEFKMLDLHLTRLGDIVVNPVEQNMEGSPSAPTAVGAGAIELQGLSFRYGEREPWIFQDLNLKIGPGEALAVTGPSGCGKTTLVKLMLGLLEPTQGTILIDGVDYRELGLKNYRQQIAAVMQDDTLFSGSISDNITFFDPQGDQARVEQSAELAAVHRDITAMSMGYNSLVGDMGTFLSGGQKQRILLARALYRQPRILFLDEATSHLDVPLEKLISVEIKKLSITRVIIAHRPQSLLSADRIVSMNYGRIDILTPEMLVQFLG